MTLLGGVSYDLHNFLNQIGVLYYNLISRFASFLSVTATNVQTAVTYISVTVTNVQTAVTYISVTVTNVQTAVTYI
jgi:hypothetical protein